MIRIEVTQLPPEEYSLNWRGHWSERYTAGKVYQAAVYYSCIDRINRLQSISFQKGFVFEKARLKLTFVFPEVRERDSDNLIARFKPGQDALVIAGLIQNDDRDHLIIGEPIVLVDKERAPLTIIELEEINE